MKKIGIVGGTGYTGVELLRILAQHPGVQIEVITSRSEAGKPVAELFPNLRGHFDLAFSAPDSQLLKTCDLVFFATPNGTAMLLARELLEAGVALIDLAADFRLRDAELWRQWYGMEHACPELLAEAVYGLPELHRDAIAGARLVANPGCYPTAISLALLPLIRKQAIHWRGIIADAKSGVSGAGRKAQLSGLMAEMGESFKAYGVAGHRHWPEIMQTLGQVAGEPLGLTFVPHLVPMIRGIEATVYAPLRESGADLQALFSTHYADEPFVDVLPPGSLPETRFVRGCNRCQLAVYEPQAGGMTVVLSVIDNLVKGAAGQAVQNMNLMLGFPETQSLMAPAWLP